MAAPVQNIINFDPRDREQNGMNEYERQTDEWNQTNQVQEMRSHRCAAINNTPAYYTGNRIHHIRSIQMFRQDHWNELFGNEILNQSLLEYAQATLDYVADQTNTALFAGQMDVSLLMQENFRPGVHVANFVVHLSPHRHFRDGHLVQIEFGEGSQTHQTISRMFDLNGVYANGGYAIVQQATEYQILGYLATDDDAMELLHSCFLQPDFAPMRFAFVEDQLNNYDDYDNDYYIQNQNAGNDHRWHEFADVQPLDDAAVAAPIRIPPPVPINNFADIYQENIQQYDAEAAYYNQDDNIIPYDSEDEDEDEDDNAQG
jgi:hypothetical protein